MTTIFEKYTIAKERFDRYENEIVKIANEQLWIAAEIFVDLKYLRPRNQLPRGNNFLYFKPCDYVKVCTDNPRKIEAWWLGSGGDSDYMEGEFVLHPIMCDESIPLKERSELLRQQFLETKAIADKSEKELKLALLAQQRRQLESQIIAIDQQLKGVCIAIDQQLKEGN